MARALSKLGYCSRAQARLLVRDGHVTVNGRRCRDPETRVDPALDRIRVHGRDPAVPARRYFMLNKPRGLVTTRADEQGRATVFRCFENASLPYLAPVGRLDRASEGLLLFTNDSAWAAAITDPATHIDKIYHVQIDRLPDTALLDRLRYGVVVQGELLAVKAARELRRGERNAWLELTLDEGRNRHLRRLLEACGCDVLRLVRIAVGPLRLGDLAAGAWRELSAEEVQSLSRARPRTR